MGVKKKARRKIVVDGKSYVWYVIQDCDSSHYVLHVLSDDKQFIVHYQLGQCDDVRHITVLGREFQRAPCTGGKYRRFRCPKWPMEQGSVTPRTVHSLINWCQSHGSVMEVDYAGLELPLGGHCTSCGVDLRGMLVVGSQCCHKCGHPILERVKRKHVG